MITVVEKVRFYETDMMGIAHHSNHIRWFECGRCEYLAAAGIDLFALLDQGISYPIKSVSCEYISPINYADTIDINYADTIDIETRLVKLSRAQMVFSYRIVHHDDHRLLATGTTQNVFAHKDSGKVARLDEADYKKLQAMYAEDKAAAQAGGGVHGT